MSETIMIKQLSTILGLTVAAFLYDFIQGIMGYVPLIYIIIFSLLIWTPEMISLFSTRFKIDTALTGIRGVIFLAMIEGYFKLDIPDAAYYSVVLLSTKSSIKGLVENIKGKINGKH